MKAANSTNRTFIFNPGNQPGNQLDQESDSQDEVIYASDPMVWLGIDFKPPQPRHTAQLPCDEVIKELKDGLKIEDKLFGDHIEYSYYKCSIFDSGQDRPPQSLLVPALHTTPDSFPPGRPLVLFSVLVALEWVPDEAYRFQLEWAFRRASDFLYDVTNGAMAFGQVIFGDKRLIPYADIQVVLSTRTLPRSWVDAMHDDGKFQPIRIGSKLWDSRRGIGIDWDEPEAYRLLAHEWGHYALGLPDIYLTADEIETPSGNVPIVRPFFDADNPSIMAHVTGNSELMAHTVQIGDFNEWEIIRERFDLLPLGSEIPADPGPRRLPLPLPSFHWRVDPPSQAPLEQDRPARAKRKIPHEIEVADVGRVQLRSYFTSAIRAVGNRRWLSMYGPPNIPKPPRLRTRSLTPPGGEIELPGAEQDDTIVLVRDLFGEGAPDDPFVIKQGNDGRFMSVDRLGTSLSTPPIAVVPGTDRSFRVVTYRKAPTGIWVFPLGEKESPPFSGVMSGRNWESVPIPVIGQQLDGHVLAEIGGRPVIATYSRGGDPPTHTGTTPTLGREDMPKSPIAAGSSDGNMLIFFNDRDFVSPPPEENPYNHLRLVTTMTYGPAYNTLPKQYGYVYALASNKQLPPDDSPTLIIQLNPKRRDVSVVLHRLNGEQWEPILEPTQPIRRFETEAYIALALTTETAPALCEGTWQGARVEFYALFEK